MTQYSLFYFTAQYSLYQKGNDYQNHYIQKEIIHFAMLLVRKYDLFPKLKEFRQIIYAC